MGCGLCPAGLQTNVGVNRKVTLAGLLELPPMGWIYTRMQTSIHI